MFLEEQGFYKKMVQDSKFGWGRYDQDKPKCSKFRHAPMNSDWTEILGTGRASWEKNLKFWQNIPWRTRSPSKKVAHDYEFGWGRYDRDKPKCFVFEPAPMNLGWTESLGTSLPFFSMMWKTRELAMTALQNELHTHTTLDRIWTYTRLENQSSPKGGPWRCHTEKN